MISEDPDLDLEVSELLWAEASGHKESISAAPCMPPSGARRTLPAYRIVTDDRSWRPGRSEAWVLPKGFFAEPAR